MIVKDINSGSSNPNELTALGNTLYFQANDGTNGEELWKSDGTASGTVMVKDIRSGSSSSSPYYLTAVGNTLYFQATDGTIGVELWKSDGTASGTVMVKDIVSGSGSGYPSSLTAVGNTLYFQADDGTNGNELWANMGILHRSHVFLMIGNWRYIGHLSERKRCESYSVLSCYHGICR